MVLKYDYTVTIVVTKRTGDYHACIKGHHKIWGCGKDENAAIGNLVRSHKSEFGIEVQHDRKENRNGFYVVRYGYLLYLI